MLVRTHASYIPWRCPLCGHDNKLSYHAEVVETSIDPGPARVFSTPVIFSDGNHYPVHCDLEEGGCDALILLRINVFASSTALIVEERSCEDGS